MSYLTAGSLLQDRYRIGAELGRGGYSVVYQALDTQLDLAVAVKVVFPPPALADKVRERMRREVMAVRALNHAHIITVYDLIEEGPWLALIMELVPAGDLQTMLARHQSLSPDYVVQVGKAIGSALALAHHRGIVHRDVKPSNILVRADRTVALADFGSAKIQGQSTMTQTGNFVGTLDYLAPEIFAGERGDSRADIYALGITLYVALTGNLPPRSSPMLPPTPSPDGYHPRALRPDIPPWLDALVARATCAEPGRRFPTVQTLIEALGKQQVPLKSTLRRINTCFICGNPEPLGLTICANCGGAEPQSSDRLIFVEQATGEQLAQLLDLPGPTAALLEVAKIQKPLAQIPLSSVPQVTQHLAQAQISIQALPKNRVWSVVPTSFYVLLGGVVGMGTIAGLVTLPVLLWVTPFIALGLLLGANQKLQSPFLNPQPSATKFPTDLKTKIMQTATTLPPGIARDLLADVLFIGQNVLPLVQRNTLQPDLAHSLIPLLAAACDATLALHRIDQTLGRLEKQRQYATQLPATWSTSTAQCEQTRDTLVQRLLESIAALGLTQSQAALAPAAMGKELNQLTQDLRSELIIQAEITKEMQALLNPSDRKLRTP